MTKRASINTFKTRQFLWCTTLTEDIKELKHILYVMTNVYTCKDGI